MGNELFGVDLAAEILDAMGDELLAGRLTQRTPGTRSASALTAGTQPTSLTYPCRGILESFALREIDGTTVRHGDQQALLLGDSLPAGVVPKSGDVLAMEGRTLTVLALLARDPAAATYLLHVRGT